MGPVSRRSFLAVAGMSAVACVALTPVQSRPNILFAISDDQSYPHTSAYGYKAVNTPAFDRIAREGVLFMNGFVASPGCSPSRAATLTGRNCWQLEHAGTHASQFLTKYVTFPDILEGVGYHVGYTGKGWGPGNHELSGWTRNPAGPVYSDAKVDAPPGIGSTDYAVNFQNFLAARPKGAPFCFWYGANEPHRVFSKGIGIKRGKKLADVVVPTFLPDTGEIRSDILDYCVEIEWFDSHLDKMVKALENIGELDNTLIVVTSDNGMAFPRAKANTYEYGIHVPLAIRWGDRVPGGRTVTDFVSLKDFAPTFIEAAGATHPSEKTGQYPMASRSIMNIITSKKEGRVDPSRDAVFAARERHSSSRYNTLSYPQRCMRTDRYLYIRNFKPERWPAGAPQKMGVGNYPEDETSLGPMHGGYHDIDACPTLTFMIDHRDEPGVKRLFHAAVDIRPGEELYDIIADPGCLNNLATDPAHAATKTKLVARFEKYLYDTQDPRILGTGDIFETYKRYSPHRKFPKPDWAE